MEASEFLNYKNWVVAGDVLDSSKYACRIYNSLKNADFKVEGVNPREKNGGVYTSLKQIGDKIEVLDLCINPKTGISIVKEAKDMGVNKILIQPGAESEEILEYCAHNSIEAIEGCALVELSSHKFK